MAKMSELLEAETPAEQETPKPEKPTTRETDWKPPRIQSIRVDAVVGGVLQSITFGPDTNPGDIGDLLRLIDPQCKVRDDFPRKGGPRETKSARALAILVSIRDSFKAIEIVAQTPEGEELSISVSKRESDNWLPALESVGKLTDPHLAKIQKAFEDKSKATVMLTEDEQFGIAYWTTDDGKAFYDSMSAEPPEVKEASDND